MDTSRNVWTVGWSGTFSYTLMHVLKLHITVSIYGKGASTSFWIIVCTYFLPMTAYSPIKTFSYDWKSDNDNEQVLVSSQLNMFRKRTTGHSGGILTRSPNHLNCLLSMSGGGVVDSKLPLDVWDPHPSCKAKPSYPTGNSIWPLVFATLHFWWWTSTRGDVFHLGFHLHFNPFLGGASPPHAPPSLWKMNKTSTILD